MGLRPNRGVCEDQRGVHNVTGTRARTPIPNPEDLIPIVGGQTLVLKLGGSVGREDTLLDDLALLQHGGARVVLVHGGGPLITAWLGRIGKETHFVRGLRYTDEDTLDVVRMVLSGLVNGEVVARIGASGGRAVGLSGSDDGMLQAVARDSELGLVGEVTSVHLAPVECVLDAGYIAVIAPVAVTEEGSFVNVNADTVAGELAAALGADRLVFFTDVDGIADGAGEPQRRLSTRQAQRLIADGIITGGMIPKVDAASHALSRGGEVRILDGRRPHALVDVLLRPTTIGTVLARD
ncbi:MAG: acetylglutamate kinase [Chloroflexi bacterium]|nr:acetylglutamate kinase [Chloroflexota bacterium]